MSIQRKKIIAIFTTIIVLLVSIIGWWFFQQPSAGKVVPNSGKYQLQSGTVREEGFQNVSQFSDVVVTECFQFQFSRQYSPKIEQNEGHCVVRSSMMDPRGLLTVSWEKRSDEDIANFTGIQHRERHPELYARIDITEQRFDTVLAYTGEQETTIFAKTTNGILTISVHDFLGTEEERNQVAKELLVAVKIKEWK